MDTLEKEQGINKVIKIRLHSNPGDEEFYTEESGKRGEMYKRVGYPTIAFNGTNVVRGAMTYKQVDDAVAQARSAPVSLKVNLGGTLVTEGAGKKLNFEGIVSQFAPLDASNMRYSFFLFEDNIEREDQYFMHVTRAIKPSAKGTSFRIKDGETKKFTASFDLKEEWVLEEMGCALAISNPDTLEVYAYGGWMFKSLHLTKNIPDKINISSPITLSFDKPVDAKTFTLDKVLLADEFGAAIKGAVSVKGSDCVFTPSSPLKDGTKYTIYVKGFFDGVKSTTGATLDDHLIQSFTATAQDVGRIDITPTSLDFGKIGTSASNKVTVRNESNSPTPITVKSSDTWLVPSTFGVDIPQNGAYDLMITIKPDGLENGSYQGKVTVESKYGKTDIAVKFEYEKSSLVLKVSPMSLDFGKVAVGEKKTLVLDISEESGASVEGTVSSEAFWVSIEPKTFSCSSCKITITAQAAGEGKQTGEIKIASNGGEIVIPVSMEVSSAALPLSLEISEPKPNTAVQSKTLQVKGKTNGVKVTVNNAPATVSAGIFSANVTLIPGVNNLIITATDSKGQIKTVNIQIICQVTIKLWLDKTNIEISGQSITLKTAPTAASPPLPADLKGSTYMPIREVAEAMNATVGWDAAEKKVTLTQTLWNGKNIVELWINKKTAKINGKEMPLDSKGKLYPAIVSGKTMLPLRFVGEALGASVEYAAAERKITLVYPK